MSARTIRRAAERIAAKQTRKQSRAAMDAGQYDAGTAPESDIDSDFDAIDEDSEPMPAPPARPAARPSPAESILSAPEPIWMTALYRRINDSTKRDQDEYDRRTERRAINRLNARYSTGPVTPEGKLALSLNALKG